MKLLDLSQSFLIFIQVSKRLLGVKRLMQFYISEYCNTVNFQAVFNLLLKLTDSENSMNMTVINRRRKLSVLITFIRCLKLLQDVPT